MTRYNEKESDEKIIAVPLNDPTYNCYKDLGELPSHIFDEIRHFFSVYKELEGKVTHVTETLGREAAIAIIQEAIDCYSGTFHR